MATSPRRRLKVFQTRIGFYDTVVAAPSRAAALRAWGVYQDLFAGGQAAVVDDPQAVAAALANPEIPLRRAIGSKDPFTLEPTSLPKAPPASRRKGQVTPKAKSARPEPAPPDRSTLDRAEIALRKIDEARKREEATLRQRQEDMDAAFLAAQQAYVDSRKAATTTVVEARKAYRKAGGHD